MNNYLKPNKLKFIIILSAIIAVISCKQNKKQESMVANNVLLEEWTGPYGGVPAFDKMNIEDITNIYLTQTDDGPRIEWVEECNKHLAIIFIDDVKLIDNVYYVGISYEK